MSLIPPAPVPQSGVIPYRWRQQHLDVLLITSRRRGRWIIPKGKVAPWLDPAASACREAYEEAGIHGVISATALGQYDYHKRGMCWTVSVFSLAVQTVLDVWPEMPMRERRWFPISVASQLVAEPDLRTLIALLATHLTPA